MWPDELKTEAARRVLAGETVAAIARDIQANESLVGKWLRDHKNATSAPGDTLHFVQVVTAPPERPSVRQSTNGAASCDLHLGDVRITVTPDYPMARLADPRQPGPRNPDRNPDRKRGHAFAAPRA